MNRLQTCVLSAIAVLAFLVCNTSAPAATLLFQDTFEDMSHLSVGDLDSGRATYSIVASPDGKAGNSLQVSYDGAAGANWVHRIHDLGSAVPLSGVVTYQWSFMHSGAFDEGKMGFTSSPATYYPMPFTLAESRGSDNKLGYMVNDAWVVHPAGGYDLESDKWYTFALVIDMDAATDNATGYLAEGLTPSTSDYWFDTTIDLATNPITKWQQYKYAFDNFGAGAWDLYIDDLSIYSGAAVPTRFPGDANYDGYVDAVDASILSNHWLMPDATWEDGDFNEDGIVNDFDITILSNNWGTVPPTENASVPEPGAIGLIVTALTSLLIFSRKRVTAMRIVTVSLTALICLASFAPVWAVTYTANFDSDAEGWIGDGSAWVSTGGQSGGYFYAERETFGPYLTPPESSILYGDVASNFNNDLIYFSYHLKDINQNANAVAMYMFADTDTTVGWDTLWRWTPADDTPPTDWTRYQFIVDPSADMPSSGWTLANEGTGSWADSWQNVAYWNFWTGTGITGTQAFGIDTVEVTSVPRPTLDVVDNGSPAAGLKSYTLTVTGTGIKTLSKFTVDGEVHQVFDAGEQTEWLGNDSATESETSDSYVIFGDLRVPDLGGETWPGPGPAPDMITLETITGGGDSGMGTLNNYDSRFPPVWDAYTKLGPPSASEETVDLMQLVVADGDSVTVSLDMIASMYFDPQSGKSNELLFSDLSYTIEASSLVPGDFNSDSKVDVTDLGILATYYGGTGGLEQGDANGDGNIDVTDLGILATNYGYGTAAAVSAVPEPSIVSMLVLGVIVPFLAIRRR